MTARADVVHAGDAVRRETGGTTGLRGAGDARPGDRGPAQRLGRARSAVRALTLPEGSFHRALRHGG